MNSEDYLSLIEVLTQHLQQAGAGELSDPRHYVEYNPETGEARLLGPRKRLIDMLGAFERFMAVRDRATLQWSLGRINALEIGARVDTVSVLQTPGERESIAIDLSGAPDLRELRAQVQQLIGQLQFEEDLP